MSFRNIWPFSKWVMLPEPKPSATLQLLDAVTEHHRLVALAEESAKKYHESHMELHPLQDFLYHLPMIIHFFLPNTEADVKEMVKVIWARISGRMDEERERWKGLVEKVREAKREIAELRNLMVAEERKAVEEREAKE